MSGTGIYGGTFDPVHNGHLLTAEHVVNRFNLEKCIFIPAKIPPFKQEKKITDDFHRVKMLEAAIEGKERFLTDTYELNSNEVSYTVKTIRHLKKSYDELYLIIGYDNYLAFEKWYKYEEILSLCKLIVLGRNVDNVPQQNKPGVPALFADSPLIDISSTMIREKIKREESISNFVPEKVEEYIINNRLYVSGS